MLPFRQTKQTTGRAAPSEAESDSDFAIRWVYGKFPQLDRDPALDAPALKKIGITQEQREARLAELFTTVRSTIAQRLEFVGAIEVGDYARFDRFHVEPNRVSEYLDMERRISKPIRLEQITTGPLKAWAITRIAMPTGAEAPFNYFSAQWVKDPSDVLSAVRSAEGLFAKVHPGVNETSMFLRTQELRRVVGSRSGRLIANV